MLSTPLTPKTSWLLTKIAGKTVVLSDEDKDFWKAQAVTLNTALPDAETIIFGEMLQKQEDPVKVLKETEAKRIIITVPNEWGWDPKYAPFKNTLHRRFYDTELLATHLEQAGLQYLITLIEYSGWSFFAAEAAIASN